MPAINLDLNLDSKQEAELRRRAVEAGLDVDTYVVKLVTEYVESHSEEFPLPTPTEARTLRARQHLEELAQQQGVGAFPAQQPSDEIGWPEGESVEEFNANIRQQRQTSPPRDTVEASESEPSPRRKRKLSLDEFKEKIQEIIDLHPVSNGQMDDSRESIYEGCGE